MGTEQAAFEYLMRLINTCKEQGITVLTTNQTAGFMNQEEISGIGISSIIDAIVILRLVEAGGELQRKLLVMKSRGSANSNRYQRFRISDQGIAVTPEGA
jgi:circadian clock protein KaiC